MQLTKKARAQCLFNPEYMEEKVIEAMEVLDSLEDEPEPVTNHFKQQDLPPATPIREYLPTPNSTPQFPSLSTLSIAPITSPITSPISTPRSLKLAEIASLPAYEIIELVKSLSLESVGISPVSAELEQDIDTFIDTLTGKDSQKSKQALGERLFKVLKFFGIKGAPRITIELLDTEPLRPLAHLINYPDI